ncbi:MAG: hypothetical protein IH614_06705, partial [Desulfuromonadales bacterium]|nr:hypothetical protein [Desulfuromonadales bacterium]
EKWVLAATATAMRLAGLSRPLRSISSNSPLAVAASTHFSSPGAVFVPTHSGATARSLSHFRLPVWIVAVSSQPQTCRNLAFSYGVYPVCEPLHPEDWDGFVRRWLEEHEVKGEMVILTEGPSRKYPEVHNRMEIIDIGRQAGG